MAGVTWKMAVLMVVMGIFTILESQIVEAQCGQCAANAYCYSTYNGYYYCRCRRGYYGDAIAGPGYSGCRRRRMTVWRVIVAVVAAVIGALLILCLCAACLRAILARRRQHGPVVVQQGQPVYGYPQQTSYSQEGVPMATYETSNQKVPGPAGVV